MSKERNPEQDQTENGQIAPDGCPGFEELSLYFDNELDAAEAARVHAHVAECRACQGVLADLQLLRQALRVSTPAASQRSFRLTPEDIRDDRPALQPVERVESEPARRVTRFTIPFLPALTAVAALLLIAIVIGDVIGGDGGSDVAITPTPGVAEVIEINGTPIIPIDQDLEGSYDAVSNEPMDRDTANEPFWDWWRIGEALLLVILAALLATIYLQNRSRRNGRNRA